MFDGAEFVKRVEDPTLLALRHARDLLARPQGWCRGAMDAPVVLMPADPLEMPRYQTAHCIYGALLAGARAVFAAPMNTADLEWAVLPLLPFGTTIPRWNDAKGRQQSDAVDLLDRAIERAIPLHSRLEVIEHV